ncbi:MAG TPA: hypothetical protein VIJ11_05175, partial [Galbitalea sp.]
DNFAGYVSFFLLQDLVSGGGAVKYFLPFEDFSTPTLPATVDEYRTYREAVTKFVTARNDRIGAMFN